MDEREEILEEVEEEDAITLSPDQQDAYDSIAAWIRTLDGPDDDGSEFSLGGYAGTGKTTLVAQLRRDFPIAGVITPTGKAADVLRKKGIAADTIHSVIYRPIGERRDEKTGKLEPIFEDKVPSFRRRDLLVVDESSMVNVPLARDLRKHGFHLLWVGDHGQLEPVGEDPRIMKDPDVRLETIHRQAAQSPIVRVAHHMREGGHPRDLVGEFGRRGGDVMVGAVISDPAKWALVNDVDQVVTAFHWQRRAINARWRELTDREGTVVVGERIMCLKNNRQLGIFNGMQFEVEAVRDAPKWMKECVLLTINDGNARWVDVPADAPSFGARDQRAENEMHEQATPFDYAYAINCHKAQGSEWDSVLVIDGQARNWNMQRWRYTAATRAKKRLAYAVRANIPRRGA